MVIGVPDQRDFPGANAGDWTQRASFVVSKDDPLLTQLAFAAVFLLYVSPAHWYRPVEEDYRVRLARPFLPWASPKTDMSGAIAALLDCIAQPSR